MHTETALKTRRRNAIAVVLMALLLIFTFVPENSFAANQINYSGGTAVDSVATVDPDLVGSLTKINKNDGSTNKTFSGDWISTSWQLRGERTGYAIKAPTGTKDWTNTYYVCPNMITIGGKSYDLRIDILKTVNLSGFECFVWTYPYNVPEIDVFGNGNPSSGEAPFIVDGLGNGFYVNTNVTIVEHGTNNKLDLNKLYFGFNDLDYHQSFSSNNMNFQNLVIKEKGHFKGNNASGTATVGNAYVNDSGVYAEPWYASDNAVASPGDGPDFFVDITDLDTYNVTLGFKSHAGSTIDFYTTTETVTYKSVHGSITGKTSEKVITGANPTGSSQTPDTDYYFTKWTSNVPVRLTSGALIPADFPMTMDQIKEVIVVQDITFTAYNEPYLKVTYEWEGGHPQKDVPEGKTDIVPEDEYDVDTSYQPGDTVYEENPTYGGKTYPRGTWTFKGWDKNGTLEITEDTVIKGQWELEPQWNIETEVVNGSITDTETNIPEGENRTITYQPDPGYQLKELTVDGEDKDISEFPVSTIFENITSDHKVRAVYEKIPGLDITKGADKSIYNAGDTVKYTVTVNQTEDSAEARDVEIVDTLPKGLTLNENSIEGDVEVVKTSPNSYTLKIASLTESITYTYTAVTGTDSDAESLINEVQARAKNVPGDPVKDTEEIKSLTPKPQLTKVVSNETPSNGEIITYTISAKEPQDGIVIKNAVITDKIPEGIEYVDGSLDITGDLAEAGIENGVITVTAPELSKEIVVTFDAKVTAASGRIINTAVLTGDGIPELKDDAPISLKEPEPVLTKSVNKGSVSVGDTVTYTLIASSQIALTEGTLIDTPPEGVEIIPESVKCSNTQWNVSVSENVLKMAFSELKEPVRITYEANVTQAGELVNTAALSAKNFPKGPLTAQAKTSAKEPTPAIEKSVDQETVKRGDTVTYSVVAYTKEGTLYDAEIVDTLPEGISLIPESVQVQGANDAKADTSGKQIVVTIPSLTSEKVTVTYRAKAEKEGTHKNVVTLTGSNYDKPPIKDEATIKVTDPKDPKDPEGKQRSPGTGDNHNPLFVSIALILAVLSSLCALIIVKRKKQSAESEN